MKAFAPALAMALLALAPLPAAAAPVAPSAPASPDFVQLVSIQGLPGDSLVRERFMAGFRGQFAEDELPAERRSGDGPWAPASAVTNRFRWLEGDADETAWQLQVVIGAPQAVVLPQRSAEHGHRSLESHRRSRGMIAAFTVQAPDPGSGLPPPVRERFAFSFPAAAADSGAVLAMPGVGYLFPWNDAGRIVARLALDVLHRQRGGLDDDERLAVAPAMRAEAGR
jgi:hypothetical protein